MAEPRPGESPGWDGVEVYCECGHLFHAKKSLKGGLTNCPSCDKAVQVPGGPEPMFWILFGGGALLVLAIAAMLFFVAESTLGAVIVLIIGAAIIGGCLLMA
jgi:hypothetical protein